MDDNFVAVRVMDDRHPADGCLALLHVKLRATLLQLLNRRVHIVHFEGDGCALIARLPIRIDVGDGKNSTADVVFNPLASRQFLAPLETEHLLVKRGVRASCRSPLSR